MALLARLEKQPLLFAVALSAIPYIGLRLYLRSVMHSEASLVAEPGGGLLFVLALLGVVLPAGFSAMVLRRLVSEREKFELGSLLQVYFSLILIFASTYAMLQASAAEPSFSGMPAVWHAATELSEGQHIKRLHEVFGNALYLSVITMTTVGYGDVVPLAVASKAATAAQGLFGIGFVGLVLGQYFAVCLGCSDEKEAGSRISER